MMLLIFAFIAGPALMFAAAFWPITLQVDRKSAPKRSPRSGA